MKKLIIIVVIAAVVVIGVGYLLGWFSPPSAGKTTVSSPTPIATQPAQTTTAPTTAAPATTTVSPAPGTPQPSPTATTTTTAPAATTTTAAPYVKLDFAINSITGSGMTRTVNAQVSNLGNEDAHNVYGVVQVTQSGSVVKINGQTSLTVQLGTLPAGTMTTVQQSISFSLLDGLKIQSSGATFAITLHSDEATATFTQFYQP
jgi:hypothetical protein